MEDGLAGIISIASKEQDKILFFFVSSRFLIFQDREGKFVVASRANFHILIMPWQLMSFGEMFKHPLLLSPSILILLFAQAFAQNWQWVRDDQFINPSGVQSFGSGKIDLGDIDGDSWLDLVVLDSVGLRFYRNRGLGNSIAFERRTDWETVLPPALWEYAVPTLADLNDDGRADLIIPANQTNSFRYWQNTGDVSGNFWTRADSIFQGVAGNQFIALADLDNDHDLDAVVRRDYEQMLYWNIGDSHRPNWQLVPEPFPVNFGGFQPNNIRFADIDGDSRPDLFAGFDWAFTDAIVNVGRNRSASDSLIFNFSSAASPMRDAGVITLAVGDVNKDGKMDLLTGHAAPFLYLWNSDFDTSSSSFYQIGNLGFPFGYQESAVALHDLKQDGSGEMILVHPELPTDIPSEFLSFSRFSRQNSLWLRDFDFYFFFEDYVLSHPTLDRVDWDGDGVFELILSADKVVQAVTQNILMYFSNGRARPEFFSDFSPDSLFQDPSLVDINGDGMLDLFLQKSGRYRFYENIGTLSNPSWQERPQWSGSLSDSEHYRAEIGDLTSDARLDIVFGERDGSLSFFRNTGTGHSPLWERDDRVVEQAKLDSFATPTLIDLDFDTDLDLILGDRLGRFHAFRNDFITSVSDESVEVATSPKPRLFQVYPNPFNAGTTLRFTVPAPQQVTIKAFDLLGREVAVLLNEKALSGFHTLQWTPENLPSGVYFIQIRIGKFVETRKAILQK